MNIENVTFDARQTLVILMNKANPKLNFYFKPDDSATLYVTLGKEVREKIKENFRTSEAKITIQKITAHVRFPENVTFCPELQVVFFEFGDVTYNFRFRQE